MAIDVIICDISRQIRKGGKSGKHIGLERRQSNLYYPEHEMKHEILGVFLTSP